MNWYIHYTVISFDQFANICQVHTSIFTHESSIFLELGVARVHFVKEVFEYKKRVTLYTG